MATSNGVFDDGLRWWVLGIIALRTEEVVRLWLGVSEACSTGDIVSIPRPDKPTVKYEA